MLTRRTRRMITSAVLLPVLMLALSLTGATSARAVSASPELLDNLRATGRLPGVVDRLKAARSNGVWRPNPSIAETRGPAGQALAFDPNSPDTFKVLVVLVDFSDHTAASGRVYGTPADFRHLLFSFDENDDHYSMAEFYRDNSYGAFILQGTVVGWVRAPQTYAYYVDNQNGFGEYPRNAQKMAEDALVLADPLVNYSQFDGDGDGAVDGVFIVHSGAGAEQTGNDSDIWSHAWSTFMPLSLDGVELGSYTTEPEENTTEGLATMGVYAHEYGHFIGLPDLYDTDYSSSGIGNWSLMAGGSWNRNGRYPAFMDAWCKKELGFLTPTNINSCVEDMAVVGSYHEPVAYRLWANGTIGAEYFLIENRRRIDNDLGIPADGLLIYHIDETQWGNADETRPLVAIEQSDGRFDLENGANDGDGGDVWTAFTVDAFDDLTVPSTRSYGLVATRTAVWNISGPDSIMTAGLEITYCRPRFELLSGVFSDTEFGNGNGVAEAGETLTFTFSLRNLWLTASNVTGSMSSDNNDFVFGTPQVNIGTVTGTGGTGSNSSNPITFTVPEGFVPCIDSFYLTVDADQSGGLKTFGFELRVGSPSVLLVDDDGGDTWNLTYERLLFAMRMPFDEWDKSVRGTPPGDTLAAYTSVVWFTGDSRADIMSPADVAAMTAFLDGGGNLFLTGQTIVKEFNSEAPLFLSDYLRTSYVADKLYPSMYGQAGTEIGDQVKIRYYSGGNQTNPQTVAAVNGSVEEFILPVGGATILSYTGDYKVVLASFGLEAIGDTYVSQGWSTKDTVFQRIMRFFEPDTMSLNPVVETAGLPAEVSAVRLTDHTPEFVWSSDDTTGAPVTQYQVQVGTGLLCWNKDNMWSPPVYTGGDTSVVYAGLELQDGESYVFSVRVFNGTTWSDWKSMSFRMNAVGMPGQGVSPVGDTVVATATPALKVITMDDPDGDVVTYEFEVYADEQLTNRVAHTTGVAQTPSFTYWTVSSALAEDARYWWRARAFDGYESAPYTAAESFLVNAVNQAPSAFSLIAPADKDTLVDSLPLFQWQASSDPDIADAVSYEWVVSTDSLFGAFSSLITEETSLIPENPLTMGATYYWKVKALDLQGAATWSSERYSFVTESTTCCRLRGDVNRDERITVSDITALVSFLFKGGTAPECEEEADADNSGVVNVADVTRVVNYVFRGGAQPPACP